MTENSAGDEPRQCIACGDMARHGIAAFPPAMHCIAFGDITWRRSPPASCAQAYCLRRCCTALHPSWQLCTGVSSVVVLHGLPEGCSAVPHRHRRYTTAQPLGGYPAVPYRHRRYYNTLLLGRLQHPCASVSPVATQRSPAAFPPAMCGCIAYGNMTWHRLPTYSHIRSAMGTEQKGALKLARCRRVKLVVLDYEWADYHEIKCRRQWRTLTYV